LGYRKGQFPHSERAAAEVLSLPMFPELSPAQCETVCDAIRSLAGGEEAPRRSGKPLAGPSDQPLGRLAFDSERR
jgi:hypothetical protein